MSVAQNTSATVARNRGIQEPTTTPFRNIALAFSGGGFRAATFALGVLSYFEQLEGHSEGVSLLQQVRFLSSASGGSFATLLYAAWCSGPGSRKLGTAATHEERFQAFYCDLFEACRGTTLLRSALTILNDPEAWKAAPDKGRSLINAFALAYHKRLFEGETFADLGKDNEANHLEEICINSTEFYRGLLFKQNVLMKHDHGNTAGYNYGNFMVKIDNRVAQQVRLADALAASSCFPGGFEPILMPNDFAWRDAGSGAALTREDLLGGLRVDCDRINDEELAVLYDKAVLDRVKAALPADFTMEDVQKALAAQPFRSDFRFGLMDGGITDNQGLESMMQAQDRRNKESEFQPFDLMMVADVGSHFMDCLPVEPPKKEYTGLMGRTIHGLLQTGARMRTTFLVVLIASIAFIVANLAWLKWPFGTAIAGTLAGISLVAYVVFSWVNKHLIAPAGVQLKGTLDTTFTPEIRKLLLQFGDDAPVGLLAKMGTARAQSLMSMSSDVFLKRVRFLLYELFNSGARTFRVKSNHVYDLAFTNDANRTEHDPLAPKPSMKLQCVAQKAYTMGTTLWFAPEEEAECRQEALVACGQFSTCYNLLDYISKMKAPGPDGKSFFEGLALSEQQYVDRLEVRLREDFDKFCNEPFWLYDELGTRYQYAGFKKQSGATYTMPKDFAGWRPKAEMKVTTV